MRGGHQFEKGPVLAQQEFLGLGKLIIFAAQWISGKPRAIGLICGQIRDVVDARGQRTGPFVRGVIADQICAAARDRLPQLRA